MFSCDLISKTKKKETLKSKIQRKKVFCINETVLLMEIFSKSLCLKNKPLLPINLNLLPTHLLGPFLMQLGNHQLII